MHAPEAPHDLSAPLALMLAAARRVKGQDQIALSDAEGRILAEPLVSPLAAHGVALPAHRVLNPQAIELAASLGHTTLPVYRRLSVGLLSIDDNDAEPDPAACGANRPMLAALLKALHCTVEDLGNVAHDYAAMRRALLKAGNLHDLVITTGGVSANEDAPLRRAVANLGEIKRWGQAIRAGSTLAFGKAGDADFIGLPGNAAPAFVAFVRLARPFIRACQGAAVTDTPAAAAWAADPMDIALDQALRAGDPLRLIALMVQMDLI